MAIGVYALPFFLIKYNNLKKNYESKKKHRDYMRTLPLDKFFQQMEADWQRAERRFNRDVQNVSRQSPPPPPSSVSQEELQKWKKSFIKWQKICPYSSILSFIFLDDNDSSLFIQILILGFIFIWGFTFLFAPFILAKKNPDNSKSKVWKGIKYYGVFFLTGLIGEIIGMMIDSIRNAIF